MTTENNPYEQEESSYEQEHIEGMQGNAFKKKANKIAKYFENHPKAILLYMAGILVISFAISLFLSSYNKNVSKVPGYNDMKEYMTNDMVQPSGAQYSLQNYQIMTKLKDTLEYLMAKGDRLTKDDTLIFLRVVDQFHKIDPTMFETVMSIKKAQQEFPLDADLHDIPDIEAIQKDQQQKFDKIFNEKYDKQ